MANNKTMQIVENNVSSIIRKTLEILKLWKLYRNLLNVFEKGKIFENLVREY